MDISPQRVRSAEFKIVRKGADPDEVQVFLNDVADELERAQNQSTAMEARARAAVARLQELSDTGAVGDETPEPVQVPEAKVSASVDESETISRTLLLAQRTADTAVAEAKAEAERVLAAAKAEAARTLDSTREMSASMLDEARNEARRTGDAERVAIAGEVEALKARRDFLESDVTHLETFLVDQRTRLRDAASALTDVAERVPGGLGEVRAPLLSAADDESDIGEMAALDDVEAVADTAAVDDVEAIADAESVDDDTQAIEAPESATTAGGDDPWVIADEGIDGDSTDDVTTTAPVTTAEPEAADDDEEFRFSFDDERS